MILEKNAYDSKFWSATVASKECYKAFTEEIKGDWVKYCENMPITAPVYSSFKEFIVSGNRSVYEGPYFVRRGQLAASAVMALLYPEEKKYIDYLNNIIFAICNEYTWSVSAHQPDINAYDKTFIDLFASETGFALSEIYTVLGDRLDPLIKEMIKKEINTRIIEPFLSDRYFWWRNGCTNNWAAVCGGSVGCTFMLMRPDLFDSVKSQLDSIMESYLSGFKEDGYCLEGTGYWHYGFGYFLTYADMLKNYTDGKEDYFALPKIKTIATFIQKMFLSEQCSVSFADGDGTLKYHIGTLHFLKKLYPDDVKVFSPDIAYQKDRCFRFALLLRSAAWFDEETYYNPESNDSEAEYYANESKWFVKRTKCYGFAAKGGNNNEHHNHNDVGTFIFAKDGKQIITDMGRGAYTKQYFRNETRYEHIECSSLGHNVPYFDESIAQKYGADFKAGCETHENGKFSMDIAKAYGDERIKSVKRVFIASEDEVKVKDTFDVSDGVTVTERLVSLYKPEVLESSVKIDSGEVFFDKALCDVTITEKVTSKKFTVYLIDFKLKPGINSFEFIFR